jgi:hypothetical protein
MKRRTVRHLLLFFALAALLAACVGQPSPTTVPAATTLPPTSTSAPTQSPTSVLPTATLTPIPANTVLPTTKPANTTAPTPTVPPPTATPTALPTSTPPPTPALVRIAFAAGATSTLVTGDLPAQGAISYVLRAEADQLMEVDLSPLAGLQLAIYAADGVAIKSPSGTTFFRGHLPRTGDYTLVLEAGAQPVSYTMSVILPQRISFAPGTTSAGVEGQLAAFGRHHYVLGIGANQLLDVGVTPQQDVQLILYGVDGTVLKSGMGGAALFRGWVPTTQDYILVLGAGAQPVDYGMNVMIPERIQFAPGAISAAEQGDLGPHQQHAYILGASGGQELQVTVIAPETDVNLVIYGVDGTVLRSGMGDGLTFEGTLPSTQDYIVALASRDQSVTYRLQVIIQ